jgi:hypothetical protein
MLKLMKLDLRDRARGVIATDYLIFRRSSGGSFTEGSNICFHPTIWHSWAKSWPRIDLAQMVSVRRMSVN